MSRAHRDEFPSKVKLAAWERCGGCCECDNHKGLKHKIIGTPIYDHYPVPAALGGPGTLENCRVLDPKCNREITNGDISAIAKTKGKFERRIGARKKKGSFRKPPDGMKYDWSTGRYVKRDE